MNGSDTSNAVKQDDAAIENNLFQVMGAEKAKEGEQNYKVLDDNLLTSEDWLNFALKNGIVSLRQAQYFNPSVDSGKVPEMTSEGYYWNSTIYTSASDIRNEEDSEAITRAEAKYKNRVRKIEEKDKKYDQDLKKLDTEHNALQTEYESLKSVIDKNVERSFKAFS